jgi:hypothetical protein
MLHDVNGTWESAWRGVGFQRSGAGFLVHQSCHFSYSSQKPGLRFRAKIVQLGVVSRLMYGLWINMIGAVCVDRTSEGQMSLCYTCTDNWCHMR